MMERSPRQLGEALAPLFKKEKKRLLSYKTKAKSYDYASAVAPHVMSFMTEARYREVLEALIWMKKQGKPTRQAIREYLRERKHALKIQAQAVLNWAVKQEEDRPWKGKYTEVKSLQSSKMKHMKK